MGANVAILIGAMLLTLASMALLPLPYFGDVLVGGVGGWATVTWGSGIVNQN